MNQWWSLNESIVKPVRRLAIFSINDYIAMEAHIVLCGIAHNESVLFFRLGKACRPAECEDQIRFA